MFKDKVWVPDANNLSLRICIAEHCCIYVSREQKEESQKIFSGNHSEIKSINQPFEYVLVLKDDFLRYLQLIPATAADHFLVADALMQWYSMFGMLLIHVNDRLISKTEPLRNLIES
jgi:hypothetical protein